MSIRHLSMSDRSRIEVYLELGWSNSRIAKEIKFSKQAISREVRRNRNRQGNYTAITADRLTKARRHQANQQFRVLSTDEKISNNDTWLTKYVIRKLKQDWSPEQIAGRLKLDHNRSISPTTIYSWIFGFSHFRYLSRHLHHIRGGNRRSRLALANRKRREEWKNAIRSIDVRPANINKRATIGHFEGDSIVSKGHNGRIVTVNERKTGYLMAGLMPRLSSEEAKLPEVDKESLRITTALRFADSVSKMFREQIVPSKQKTLTLDNGSEMAGYEWIERDSRNNKANGGKGVKVYFCHPYHSWERGSNENTNGLLRFYFPKKMDFGELTQSQLDWAVDRINNRPRKRLGYRTPRELMKRNKCLT